MKTKDEVQALKDSWLKDPCWDIEDTEGFEDHYEELLAYRKEANEERARQYEEGIARRARKILVETGIENATIAQSIMTYEEIERDVAREDYNIGNASTVGEVAALTIARAQVRATLLLAAQMQRIADALESAESRDSLAESVRIWGTGEK